jgi:hypothetical protein
MPITWQEVLAGMHPNQTACCEAIEMKKSLIDDYRVSAGSIIVEPINLPRTSAESAGSVRWRWFDVRNSFRLCVCELIRHDAS